MTHQVVSAQLDEFLDGSLAADARWKVAAHLDECAVCREHVATQARLRGLVRERLAAVEPPPGLSARLSLALAAEAIAPHPVAHRPRFVVPIRLVAVLGSTLAALWLLVAVAVPAAKSSADLTTELIVTHTLFAHDESLFDVAGDAPAVTAWFRDAVGLQVSAPDIDHYTLVGGRLIALDGRPVAQLVYEGKPEGVYLSLLQFKHAGLSLGPIDLSNGVALGQDGPTSSVILTAGEERIALIGTAPAAELRRLAGDLARRSQDHALPTA
jgi:anti-sigma factor RsiW